MDTTVIDINSLVQDDHNFNKGTEEGGRLMQKSFTELGAGRSILIDKDNRIIAGNKSQQAAIASGITKVRVIETSGDELIAVKRTDISLDSKQGRELALADNITSEINLDFNKEELEKIAILEGIILEDWSVDLDNELPDVENMFRNADDTSLVSRVSDSTGRFQVTFLFDKTEQIVLDYININGKDLLKNKILELCQDVEAK